MLLAGTLSPWKPKKFTGTRELWSRIIWDDGPKFAYELIIWLGIEIPSILFGTAINGALVREAIAIWACSLLTTGWGFGVERYEGDGVRIISLKHREVFVFIYLFFIFFKEVNFT